MRYFTNQSSIRVAPEQTSTFETEMHSKFSPILITSLQLSLLLTLVFMTLPIFASTITTGTETSMPTSLNTMIETYSIEGKSNFLSKSSQDEKLQIIENKLVLGDSDQSQNKTLNLTRDVIIIEKKSQAKQEVTKKSSDATTRAEHLIKANRNISYDSFIIYNGYSQLIEDYDEDGYYQTFSVTFDADLITNSSYNKATVYAELYLSKNGGPWEHYYTTNDFDIYGESSDDDYEVYSTLRQGFSDDNYDVLIDLYEVGYSEIIASYSSDDNNSLYALPLESSDYDVVYDKHYEETYVYGGSVSWLNLLSTLVMFSVVMFIRQFNKTYN